MHLCVYEKENPASYACEVRLWISYFKCLPSLIVKLLLKLKKKNAVIPQSVKGLAFPIDWTSFDLLFLLKFCDTLKTGNCFQGFICNLRNPANTACLRAYRVLAVYIRIESPLSSLIKNRYSHPQTS